MAADVSDLLADRPGGDVFNDWTCPFCGEELTGAHRVSHLTGHD